MAGRGKKGAETSAAQVAERGKFANLAIIWRFVARYKAHVAGAALALLIAALATLAIPSAFRLIIDRGFSGEPGDISRWFNIC
jgi:ATP-binding cassette subfamily B protein